MKENIEKIKTIITNNPIKSCFCASVATLVLTKLVDKNARRVIINLQMPKQD